MSFLIRAFGANTPWYRTRLCRGRGTSAASLLRKSRGENNIWVVPLRNGFFSSYWTCPSVLTVSLSRQIAGLVTYLQRRSNRSRWYDWQDTAALSEKPSRSEVKTFSGSEKQCLDFHKTKRVVRSVSAAQVRKKMYKGSSEAWRKYEVHLQPLINGLQYKN